MITNKFNILSPNQQNSILTISLKGISQVLLIENAMTGLFILIGIGLSSFKLAIIAFLSSLIGTLIGKYGGGEKTSVQIGLFGFNSVLTGIAIIIFMADTQRWFIALVGAAVVAVMMAGMMHVSKKMDIPVLTLPFILITWFLLLSTYYLNAFVLSPNLVPQQLSTAIVESNANPHMLIGVFKGISEVYLIDSFWTGVLILIGVFWAGKRLGVYVVISTVVAWITAYLLGADAKLINLGLFGYNAVLTMIAVELTYGRAKPYAMPITGILASILTVPITASLDSFLMPFGLPTLTIPFVLCSWLFISARKVLPNL